ncbi:MAG: hypothetical protein FWF07_01535 [Methanomassiliicoccaceae archaeon]|nr:hypothetical protein [Methanomassiliicoccaceae archaeon]
MAAVSNRTGAYLAMLLGIILIIIAIASTLFLSRSMIRLVIICIVGILMLGYGAMLYTGKL